MAFIAAPVAVWASGGAAVVAATGITAAGALAGSVVAGIVTGAVIGAATAAITGGNILKGALMGGIVGGISAGILGGMGSPAVGSGVVDPGGAAALSPGNAMATPVVTSEVAPATGLLNAESAHVSSLDPSNLANLNATSQLAQSAATQPGQTGSWFSKIWEGMSPEVRAGVVRGGANALSKVGAQMMENSASKDLAEWEAREADRKKASNKVSTDYEQKVANVTIPQLWKNFTAVDTKVTV